MAKAAVIALTVGQCEWADYPRAVLEKHWPGLPRWRDIHTLTKESFCEQTGLESVTVLSGGFPCQPFSTAGKRRGKEDDRYLWPEMLRVIQEIRPRWVIGENVAGIVSMALDTVLSDLENLGYTCQAVIVPACAVDAPHRRDRCAILGYSNDPGNGASGSGTNVPHPNSTGLQGCKQHGTFDKRGAEEPHRPIGKCGTIVANPQRIGLWQDCDQPDCYIERDNQTSEQSRWSELCKAGCGSSHVPDTGSILRAESVQTRRRFSGFSNLGWWAAEPNVGRVAHGVPNRVDRLKCLGNAVVPQQFFPMFDAIAKLEDAL